MKRIKCHRCGYEWEPKTPRPKGCPRCKQRLDFKPRRGIAKVEGRVDRVKKS